MKQEAAAHDSPAVVLAQPADVLREILRQIKLVNFREVVGLQKDTATLRQKHYLITVVEEVLRIAKVNKWGLCRSNGCVYVYNGAYWTPIAEDDLKAFLRRAAEKMGVERYEAKHFLFGDNLYKQFFAEAYMQAPVRSATTVKINVLNGTFHLEGGKQSLNSYDRDDFLTYQLPFRYDRSQDCPLFQKFLDRVIPDLDCKKLLAEFIGYVFVPTSLLKLEKALLLYGQGANGKSVFFEIIRAMLGPENISHYSLENLTTGNAYCRAQIGHKLLNYASELSGRMDVDVFKQLVSGEPVEARLPYGVPFIMDHYGKFIFNCNHLPVDVEHTHAYFRRLITIPFNVTIPEAEQDKGLAARIIETELSGVFNWMLGGLNRLLRERRFTESHLVTQQIEDYKRQSDSVRSFLDDYEYVSHPEFVVSRQQLYLEYRNYCLNEGNKPVNNRNFGQRLANCGIVGVRRAGGHVHFLSRQAS